MDTQRRPLTFDDLVSHLRASQPRVSPDGRWVVFVGSRPDFQLNRNVKHLFRVPLAGGPVEPLTTTGTANTDPAFSPDGRFLAFTSNRSGRAQVWLLPWEGGEARQVTRFRTGARCPVFFPDGKRILAVSAVYEDTNDPAEIDRRQDEADKQPVRPRVVDHLLFRHWDAWTEGMVDHLFVVDVATGEARDLTPGPFPVPPRALTGPPDFAVSPDGRDVAWLCLPEAATPAASSTSIQVFVGPAEGGASRRVSRFAGGHAFPAWSPCGRWLAFVGMRRAGYESDRREVQVWDRETDTVREVAPGFDHSADAPSWSPDGQWLCFTAEDRGRNRVWVVPSSGGAPRPVTSDGWDRAPAWTRDGRSIVFQHETLQSPPDVWRVDIEDLQPQPLTRLAAENVAVLDLPAPEEFSFPGARGATVHGFLLKPPGFVEGRRYPTVFLLHGGPQGAWGLDFHERWNPQMFAAPGYVVVLINPRGSTGYGQAFTDAIRGEWGGACAEDILRGVDHVLRTFPFCDPARLAAAGASFGGYLVAWLATRTDRFRCMVCHDGIFNTEMSTWLTDELWFPRWEYEGLPWDDLRPYRQYSPHLYADRLSTPMLVVQGEQDFRCTVAEGLGLFTALQVRNVPSRLLYFPDEGHWVLKPRNRRTWWTEVLGWLHRYLDAPA